jgi:hypothetical protein
VRPLRGTLRALILVVAACAHREAPAPPPPAPPPPVDAAPADAPPIPTATGSWDKQEVESTPIAQPAADAVRSAVHAQLAAIRRCYDDKTVVGAQMPTGVELTIARDGHVTKVRLRGGDRYTAPCVERVLEKTRFPASADEIVVVVPFTES